MKKIKTQGIGYIELLNGTSEWYWGSDYCQGDLYEAEELFHNGHPVKGNRIIFIHYPDGRVVEPINATDGQYFGRPVFFEDKIYMLLADFQKGSIQIWQYDDDKTETGLYLSLPLTEVKDCYNLILETSPLMLTRQANDNEFQVIWPEKAEFKIGNTETFCYRENDKMYFSRWFEDPDYREEVIVRKYPAGEITEEISGTLIEFPKGQHWILQ